MRRKDREVTGRENILAILDRCEVMRIGLCDGDKPYVVPMNFACETVGDDVFLYFHCAREGRKLDIISKNGNVCFEADCSFKALEAEVACEWSAVFESVIGEGKIAVLADEAKKIGALDALMKKYGFQGKPDYTAAQLEAVTVLRICVESMTGKRRASPI